jgi:UDP-glucose 4-epimerase
MVGVENEYEYLVDITNREKVVEAIDKIKPDIIYHLAASLNRVQDFNHFDKVNAINHQGTYNLLWALKELPYQNFIFTSTSEIYGDNSPPFHEQQIPNPISPYSLTKLYGEHLIQTFSHIHSKNYTILRLFNFYGKDMPPNFFIPQLIKALKNNKEFEMTEGEQKRDFLYIDDVIEALLLSAKNDDGYREIMNVCNGNAVTIKQLAEETKNKLNSDCKIKFGAIPYRNKEVWNMVGDNRKIKEKLGFEPKFDLEKGIALSV